MSARTAILMFEEDDYGALWLLYESEGTGRERRYLVDDLVVWLCLLVRTLDPPSAIGDVDRDLRSIKYFDVEIKDRCFHPLRLDPIIITVIYSPSQSQHPLPSPFSTSSVEVMSKLLSIHKRKILAAGVVVGTMK